MLVVQKWIEDLTFQQQTVLLSCVRGPDNVRKTHPTKGLVRMMRRAILINAWDGNVFDDFYAQGGGSFMGPLTCGIEIERYFKEYLDYVDELPHHFQLHFMHAAEIVGYKHPDEYIRGKWNDFYKLLANDAHLHPESEKELDERLDK